MSDNVRFFLQSSENLSVHRTIELYDSYAEIYEQETAKMESRAAKLAVDSLNLNFPGNRAQVQVLDVACGTGVVAKLMFELGFRHFVGVDGSENMLQQAAKSGLYQDLKLALLGRQPLPAQPAAFDVVMIVGALDFGFVPVSVVRELCRAAKPGGYICMARGHHTGPASSKYKEALEKELQLMEEEGLWSPAGIKVADRYIKEPQIFNGTESISGNEFISGIIYLYKKNPEPSIH